MSKWHQDIREKQAQLGACVNYVHIIHSVCFGLPSRCMEEIKSGLNDLLRKQVSSAFKREAAPPSF